MSEQRGFYTTVKLLCRWDATGVEGERDFRGGRRMYSTHTKDHAKEIPDKRRESPNEAKNSSSY